MKIYSYFLPLVFVLISCSNPNDRVINALNTEIGSTPTTTKFNSKEFSYKWKNVDSSKREAIRLRLNHELNASPLESRYNLPVMDAKLNIIPEKHQDYFIYKCLKFGAELDYFYSNSKNMEVELRINRQ